ncbi:MAG: alpha/beta fold hydrolase [Firmicutes bacterium]|nr:alpha/beta fold hydrolase [Bacillota bacterium]
MEKLNGRAFMDSLCVSMGEPALRFKGSTKEEFEKWKAKTLPETEKMLRLDKLELRPFGCEKREHREQLISPNGTVYTRELWYVDTLADLSMPVYVLVPKNGTGKAALAIHSHGSDGKNGLVGIINEEIEESEKKFSFTYAFDMLEKGYTVFCPDMLGSGERRPVSPDKPKKSDCSAINNALMSMGYNLLGIFICELKRAVDFIFKFDGADPKDLICVGFSSGGLNALWLAAVDERVKTVYVSGYFHSLRKTALHSNFCGCNFVPDMWSNIDMDTPAMFVAPRKLYIETGADDNLNGADGLQNVYKLTELVHGVYEDIFKSDNFKFKVCDGKHRWYGAFMDEI